MAVRWPVMRWRLRQRKGSCGADAALRGVTGLGALALGLLAAMLSDSVSNLQHHTGMPNRC